MNCRHCNTPLSDVFIDLVNQPPSNAFLTKQQLNEPEVFYPLKLYTCPECFLVQIDEYKKSQDIFSDDYVYFSSVSSSWVEHARRYCEAMTERFGLGPESLVTEIASNDGYLLQWFVKAGVPCFGVEPTGGTADAAEKAGVPTLREFFGTELARRLVSEDKKPDLLLGNNVLAHVPDINDFVAGMKTVLAERGVITMEFPHLMRLVEQNQFDTIYHEHFSYLSFNTVSRIFKEHGLTVFDVEELPTHGGSLRVFARHAENELLDITPRVAALLLREETAGMKDMDFYRGFQAKADAVKTGLLTFLIEQKRAGKSVAAYGAAAKGNTLLNYCGVRSDLVDFCVDMAPSKQGKYMPGSHIPVLSPEALKERKPDFVLILPWNIRREITRQHAYIADWGGRFAVPIPETRVL